MASQNDDQVNCENCNENFDQQTLLKHIAKKVECKNYYGQRFIEMKKEKNRNRVNKHRTNLTSKEKQKKWKRQRE